MRTGEKLNLLRRFMKPIMKSHVMVVEIEAIARWSLIVHFRTFVAATAQNLIGHQHTRSRPPEERVSLGENVSTMFSVSVQHSLRAVQEKI